jgi:hypothetical protein
MADNHLAGRPDQHHRADGKWFGHPPLSQEELLVGFNGVEANRSLSTDITPFQTGPGPARSFQHVVFQQADRTELQPDLFGVYREIVPTFPLRERVRHGTFLIDAETFLSQLVATTDAFRCTFISNRKACKVDEADRT